MAEEKDIVVDDGHQTRLLYTETSSVDKANRLFGACYNGNTVIMINPRPSMFRPYIRVPEGMYALVQNQGRDMDFTKDGVKGPVWPAGFHWAGPWTQVSHLITKQFIVFETPVRGCKTADNVTVRIDICLIFRIMGDASKGEDPNLVRRFVYELGPNGLEVQLRAAQDEAVRALARSVQHTEVYKLRDGTMQGNFNTGKLAMLNRNSAPTEVKTFGEETNTGEPQPQQTPYFVTEDIKKNLNAQFNNYGLLSYKEEIDTTKLARKMMLMEEEQTGKAKCAEIQKEIDMVDTDTRVIQEQIAQETRVECNKIAAEASLAIEQIHADTKRISSEIAFRSDTDIRLVEAEEEACKLQLQAEIEELISGGEAKAKEIVARAEGSAAKKLEQYRAHQLDMQRLEVLASLSQNPKTVVTGNASNSLLAEMMVANQLGKELLNIGEGGFKGLAQAS
ncbi:SPFH domain / Band 7 family [Phytophthora infestans]|uniref:SPFH domain / Band 7 family n=1 Tax=Phytophthora infestans TaxID=4787 RepID=A0A8S9V2B7_PHYIN|nr:SPFH domain / Band 7 family [Phytophthora infestans]